jgi:hypothetical protein
MIQDYKQRFVEAQQNPFAANGELAISETNAAVGISRFYSYYRPLC